jgi:hypothetical protein
LPQLGLHRPDNFLLRQFAIQTSQRAFHFAQVPKFLSQSHIAICDKNIADCDTRQEKSEDILLWTRTKCANGG